MSIGGAEFILAIAAISTAGWLVSSWIRARHGYPLENEWFGKSAKSDGRKAAALEQENAALKPRLDHLDTYRTASLAR